MYNSVFLSSFGSNIYDTLGALETMKDNLKNTIIWNSVGSASLIIFFKILGFTFKQTYSHLKLFDLAHTFINGYCIIPEDEESKKKYISEWLTNKIEINNLISDTTTLSEIYKLTNIFPNFIVWSRKGEELCCINPKTFPKMTIIESILSTLSCIGTHAQNDINEDTFSLYSVGNFYPFRKEFLLEKKKITTLYVAHNSQHSFGDLVETSPFSYIENEIMSQFIEGNNSCVKNIDLENYLIIYNDIYKNSFTDIKKDFCFENGKIQAQNFIDGFSNSDYYSLKKIEITNQN